MNAMPSLSMDAALLTDRDYTMERIYAKTYPMVRHYVREHGGSEEDAKDLFHEAMIIYFEKTVQQQLVLTSSVSTYLMGICKNRWLQELDNRRRSTELVDNPVDPFWEEPATGEDDEPALKLMTFVDQLGETCKSILVSFYYFGHRLEQIARQHGYQTVRSATVQKFKCLERLRKTVSHLSIDRFKS